MNTVFKMRDVKQTTNTFCGPAVISSLTGIPTCKAEKYVKQLTDETNVKGMWTRDLLKVLQVFGIHATSEGLGNVGRSLKYFLFDSDRDRDEIYLVTSGRHFQLVKGMRFVCGITREMVSVNNPKVRTRTLVSEVYKLSAHKQLTLPKVEEVFKKERSLRQSSKDALKEMTRKFNASKYQVNKMCTQLGFRVDSVTRTGYDIRISEEIQENLGIKDRFGSGWLSCYYDKRDWEYEIEFLIQDLKEYLEIASSNKV